MLTNAIIATLLLSVDSFIHGNIPKHSYIFKTLLTFIKMDVIPTKSTSQKYQKETFPSCVTNKK